MAISSIIYVSKRAQRLFLAFLCLFLAQTIVASCTPEPTNSYAVTISIEP